MVWVFDRLQAQTDFRILLEVYNVLMPNIAFSLHGDPSNKQYFSKRLHNIIPEQIVFLEISDLMFLCSFWGVVLHLKLIIWGFQLDILWCDLSELMEFNSYFPVWAFGLRLSTFRGCRVWMLLFEMSTFLKVLLIDLRF